MELGSDVVWRNTVASITRMTALCNHDQLVTISTRLHPAADDSVLCTATINVSGVNGIDSNFNHGVELAKANGFILSVDLNRSLHNARNRQAHTWERSGFKCWHRYLPFLRFHFTCGCRYPAIPTKHRDKATRPAKRSGSKRQVDGLDIRLFDIVIFDGVHR